MLNIVRQPESKNDNCQKASLQETWEKRQLTELLGRNRKKIEKLLFQSIVVLLSIQINFFNMANVAVCLYYIMMRGGCHPYMAIGYKS